MSKLKIKKTLKILLPIIIIIAVILLVKYLYQSKKEKTSVTISEHVWQVETVEVKKQKLKISVILYGTVESPSLYKVSSPGFGRLNQLLVKEGDKVKQEDILAMLDEQDFLPLIKSSQAKVDALDAQIKNEVLKNKINKKALIHQKELLQLGQKSLQRTQKLSKNKLSSQAESDEAKKQVIQQKLIINTLNQSIETFEHRLNNFYATRTQAVSELEKQQLAFDRSKFYAPYDGVISDLQVAIGDQLNIGQILFSIYPSNHFEIKTKIPFQIKSLVEKKVKSGISLYAYLSEQSDISSAAFKLVRQSGKEDASGVEVYFSSDELLEENTLNFRPGALKRLILEIPMDKALYKVPYSTLYGKDKLYKINKDKDNNTRMYSVQIEVMGDHIDEEGITSMLVKGDDISDGDKIVSTRLPSAINGLKVKVVNN